MINGIILKKFDAFNETLIELKSLGLITTSQLKNDWKTRKAIERNLQILVEIVIDICQRIIALSNQPPVSSGRESIQRCIKIGALSDFNPYSKMVQFRNFIVHRYEYIELEILVSMVTKNLGDFDKFRNEIISYVKKQDQ